MQFIQDHLVLILGALYAFEQVIAEVPSIKANSSFQLCKNILKFVMDSVKPPAA